MSYSGFKMTFRCYPITDRPNLQHGGKIILPPSSLDKISQLLVQYPLIFEISNANFPDLKVHGGVLEFIAQEGRVEMPGWNLSIEPGQFVRISTVNLPLGKFVKFQPQSKTFLDISNPRAVLEVKLRDYTALGLGETIVVEYLNRDYPLTVLEIKPTGPNLRAISIVETDLIVDFAPPADMPQEETYVKKEEKKEEDTSASKPKTLTKGTHRLEADEEEKPKFTAFSGSGYSLKSKPTSGTSTPAKSNSRPSSRVEDSDSDSDSEEEKKKPKFVAFGGVGHSLKRPK
ncbi:ubiquitin fusion degradation UFD1 family protein [Planoprotostelium fungivorum]|uniref:Ubiquitin fusion degradation UFD1 family protein n=1 Tax=Planoprotostelium fungivorum TaxID=1890364 RepID=A0A2P6NRA0_9EUKA|nr:ubiquitin fusion degradation UFD1 family protein [Planoprotostelium fungivorum]